jgi:hypothetical protein
MSERGFVTLHRQISAWLVSLRSVDVRAVRGCWCLTCGGTGLSRFFLSFSSLSIRSASRAAAASAFSASATSASPAAVSSSAFTCDELRTTTAQE